MWNPSLLIPITIGIVAIGLLVYLIHRVNDLSRLAGKNNAKAEHLHVLISTIEKKQRIIQDQKAMLHDFEHRFLAIEQERVFQKTMMQQILSIGRRGTPIFIEEDMIEGISEGDSDDE